MLIEKNYYFLTYIKNVYEFELKMNVLVRSFFKGVRMKVRVNRGTLSRRCSKRQGDDGFSVLFPGIYEGEMLVGEELVLLKPNDEKVYLPLIKIQEKINSGDITFLDIA